MRRRHVRVSPPRSGLRGFRFPPDVIMIAVRWYLHYGLSYRDCRPHPGSQPSVRLAACTGVA